MNEQMLKELQEWVIQNYNQEDTGLTSECSYGNYDDCFTDGESSGTSWAAYQVGQILGMKLEEPCDPDEDDF